MIEALQQEDQRWYCYSKERCGSIGIQGVFKIQIVIITFVLCQMASFRKETSFC